MVPAKRSTEEQLRLLAENHPGRALRETGNRSGALVRVEPEKLAVETVSPQSSSGGIVIRVHGVEAEFPLGTGIGLLVAFVRLVIHSSMKNKKQRNANEIQ